MFDFCLTNFSLKYQCKHWIIPPYCVFLSRISIYAVYWLFHGLVTISKNLQERKERLKSQKSSRLDAWEMCRSNLSVDCSAVEQLTHLADSRVGFRLLLWGSVQTPEGREPALALAAGARHGLRSPPHSGLRASCYLWNRGKDASGQKRAKWERGRCDLTPELHFTKMRNTFISAAHQYYERLLKLNEYFTWEESYSSDQSKGEYKQKVIKEHFTEWFMEINLS